MQDDITLPLNMNATTQGAHVVHFIGSVEKVAGPTVGLPCRGPEGDKQPVHQGKAQR